jgi:hypothetical protein
MTTNAAPQGPDFELMDGLFAGWLREHTAKLAEAKRLLDCAIESYAADVDLMGFIEDVDPTVLAYAFCAAVDRLANRAQPEPAEAKRPTSESEDRQALDHICQFLCRIGGWDEIDGDGDEGSIIVDHIGRILDPPWAEAEGASA